MVDTCGSAPEGRIWHSLQDGPRSHLSGNFLPTPQLLACSLLPAG